MLFNSYEFLGLFLPICIVAVFLVRRTGRIPAILVLIAASILFYATWDPGHLWLLAASILFNYVVGNLVFATRSRWLLGGGVAVNLAVLAYFKYRVFAAGLVGWHVAEALVIPLGVSFYTFHQISFIVDVYRKNVSPRGFVGYLLYVSFFPQLIAGPIVRFTEVINQFKSDHAFRLRSIDIAIGVTMIAAGLFKKQVLADSFAAYATPVFTLAETATRVSFLEAWTGVLAYTFQIYFDFSGYTDMALGIARIFGIRLPVNFNSPYKATSIVDFWRRWHISLSRFLRDYLYVALGGNRRGRIRRYANVLVVMLLGGLWHGADWTFVLWGGLHGGFLMVNHAWRDVAIPCGWRIPPLAGWLLSFVCLVVAWTAFRAGSLHGALNLWQAMSGIDGRLLLSEAYRATLDGWGALALEALGFRWVGADEMARAFPMQTTFLWLGAGFAVCLGLPNTQAWLRRYRSAASLVYGDLDARTFIGQGWRWTCWRPTVAWAVMAGLMALVAIIRFGDTSEFIYWQF